MHVNSGCNKRKLINLRGVLAPWDASALPSDVYEDQTWQLVCRRLTKSLSVSLLLWLRVCAARVLGGPGGAAWSGCGRKMNWLRSGGASCSTQRTQQQQQHHSLTKTQRTCRRRTDRPNDLTHTPDTNIKFYRHLLPIWPVLVGR